MKRVEEMGELRDFFGERGLTQFYQEALKARGNIPNDHVEKYP
jgi:hypothetical protein